MNARRALFGAVMLSVATFSVSATSDYCKQIVAKPIETVSSAEYEKCKGSMIAAAICKGFKEGKEKIGCLDNKTSLIWAASSDP